MDLPDDIFSMIITNLDLPSRLKLRVNRRLNRVELATKNELARVKITELEGSFSIAVREWDVVDSIDVSDKKLGDLKEGLKRIAMNTTFVATTFDLEIELLEDISNRSHPIFDQLDYNFLLSICENRAHINLEHICDSLSVQEWVQIRQKMLSREIPLKYINFYVDETVARAPSSSLFMR
ncbi:hypothetical protein PFISCL1PPCAC_19220 [Pristionchus fissidentatus]|uniref:F-box domain-containing protein n=1 Tax=Pristionchus fissidentatus TaxID=1538716 RepID=A0AAV5WB54_9BILA|nr:hypothetical protein PFISCL1PPCAC_19220 [Pristionchus fissidentatus]